MHRADIIWFWNSFLSGFAGTGPAWLRPKSITVRGLLVSIWWGKDWHSVQVPCQTFNLKCDAAFFCLFLFWRTCLIAERCAVLWMRKRRMQSVGKLVRGWFCHVSQVGTETMREYKTCPLKPQSSIYLDFPKEQHEAKNKQTKKTCFFSVQISNLCQTTELITQHLPIIITHG